MAQNTKKPNTNKPANKPNGNGKPTTVEDLDDEDLDAEEAEEAEEDDLDATPAADGGGEKSGSWKETMKLPPAKRVAVRLGNLVDRVQHQLDAMKSWKGDEQERIKGIVVQAQDGLKAAAEALAAIPDDWRPSRSAGGAGGSKADIKADDYVRITDKRLPEYQDIITPECARGIRVKEIRGNKVVGVMADGVVAMLPRGHVTLDDAPAATQAAS